MFIFEIVGRMGRVRATYCMREDALYAIEHEYPACLYKRSTRGVINTNQKDQK